MNELLTKFSDALKSYTNYWKRLSGNKSDENFINSITEIDTTDEDLFDDWLNIEDDTDNWEWPSVTPHLPPDTTDIVYDSHPLTTLAVDGLPVLSTQSKLDALARLLSLSSDTDDQLVGTDPVRTAWTPAINIDSDRYNYIVDDKNQTMSFTLMNSLYTIDPLDYTLSIGNTVILNTDSYNELAERSKEYFRDLVKASLFMELDFTFPDNPFEDDIPF